MTKKEERVQNLSIKFKIKITRKEAELKSLRPEIEALKLGKGLYSQLQNGQKTTYVTPISLKEMRKSIEDVFYRSNPPTRRRIKIHVNEEGMKEYQKAVQKELLKITNNEHRKKLSFRSPFPKQAN